MLTSQQMDFLQVLTTHARDNGAAAVTFGQAVLSRGPGCRILHDHSLSPVPEARDSAAQ